MKSNNSHIWSNNKIWISKFCSVPLFFWTFANSQFGCSHLSTCCNCCVANCETSQHRCIAEWKPQVQDPTNKALAFEFHKFWVCHCSSNCALVPEYVVMPDKLAKQHDLWRSLQCFHEPCFLKWLCCWGTESHHHYALFHARQFGSYSPSTASKERRMKASPFHLQTMTSSQRRLLEPAERIWEVSAIHKWETKKNTPGWRYRTPMEQLETYISTVYPTLRGPSSSLLRCARRKSPSFHGKKAIVGLNCPNKFKVFLYMSMVGVIPARE